MNFNITKYTLLLFLFTIIHFVNSQSVEDLYDKSLDEIEKQFQSFKKAQKKEFSSSYLHLAKQKKDTLQIANGYYFLSNINENNSLGIKYADSILSLTKDKNHGVYPAKGYLQKGIQLYYLSRHSEALENYLKANNYYNISNDGYGQLCVRHYIGLLKNSIEESDESLKFFRENLLFFKDKKKQLKHGKQYLKSLFALADSYNRNKVLDSAEIFNKRGIIESLNSENKYLYPFFLLSYGVTKYFKGEYDLAIDSLQKGNKLLRNEKTVLAGGNLYLYKSFQGKKQIKKAVEHLKKNDSIFKENPEIIFEAKESYELLYKYYKQNNDSKNHLKTIVSLLAIDSIINRNYKNLSKQIVIKYETPILIAEKVRLISELQKKGHYDKLRLRFLIVLTITFAFFFSYFFIRNRTNKKKFNSLISKENMSNLFDEEKADLIETTTTSISDISEELVKDILNKLHDFEKSNKVIKKNYTLNLLAKELKTNSSYLSKIINSSKQVNFSNYINKLKIDIAINKLKNEKSFRRYTVQAIAKDVGFNTAQSFSTAFYKQTGISVSYFIKQLNNDKQPDFL